MSQPPPSAAPSPAQGPWNCVTRRAPASAGCQNGTSPTGAKCECTTSKGPCAATNGRTLASTGLGTIACCLLLLGQFRGQLGLTLTLCAVLGIGAALLAIPAQTTIQEDTPESLRGKVFGLQNNLINIALSLPLVLAGTVVSWYGLLPVLWVLAGIALVAALFEQPWRRC